MKYLNHFRETITLHLKRVRKSRHPLAAARITRDAERRRGATTVLGVFLASALVVLLAMTLDLGNISVARSELRRTADAAALAACWELYDQRVSGAGDAATEFAVFDSADLFAGVNPIANEAPQISSGVGDIQLGYWTPSDPNTFDTTDPGIFNAVRVIVRREDQANGEVPLFFSKVLGREGQSLRAESIAAMMRSIAGFELSNGSSETIDLLPIALDLPTWEQVVTSATEDKYKICNGQVVCGSDGLFECNLYPKGNGSPGNRGTVDIGGANNSTNDIARQVLYGLSADDLTELGRPLAFDSNGRLALNGDTGISAGIKDELSSIIGERRIIPIFESVSGNGNNAMYSIVAFEGIRILEVKLTGPGSKKRVVIQPAPMLARNAIVDYSSTSDSNYLYTPVMLVQ